MAGLEVGADDYVAKPFSPRELTARVKAVLRRVDRAPEPDDLTQLGPLVLARGAREVHVNGLEVQLTQREFDLLEYLVRHAGQVVTRDQLLESVWGFVSPGETRTVEVHVASLRKKLGRPDLIRTVRGLGYRLAAIWRSWDAKSLPTAWQGSFARGRGRGPGPGGGGRGRVAGRGARGRGTGGRARGPARPGRASG